MKRIFITLLSAAAVLVGCQQKQPVAQTDAMGTFTLSVSCASDDYTEKVLVKSESGVAVNTDQFNVTLTKQFDEYGTPATWTNSWTFAEFPEVLELAPGQYKIQVNSPVVDRTSTLAPVFAAEKTFTIYEDKVTNLEVVCAIKNMKVTPAPTANFFTELKNFTISVTAEYEGIDTPISVSWSDGDFSKNSDGTYTTSKVAFFEAVPLTVMVTGYRTLDGSEASIKKPVTISDVAPRDHHILNVDVQVTGEAKSMIVVDPSLNDPKENEVFVPGFEEIPVPDQDDKDPEAESKETSLLWDANPDFNPVTLTVDGENVIVDPEVSLVVKCPRRISSFIINVSDNFKTIIPILTTNGVDYLDLVNDQKLIEFFVGAMYLPTGTDLAGKTNVEFNLTSFAQMIPVVAVNDQEETMFTLEVIDMLNNKYVKEIKFITSNPTSVPEEE